MILIEIDYFIGSHHITPVEDSEHFVERILKLPEISQCFTPPDFEVTINSLPALKNNFVTFGCLNKSTKINDDVILLWSEILNRVGNSKLFLKSKQLDNLIVVNNIKEKFKKNGINAEKIITEGKSNTRKEILKKYNQIDIALDPFPYPGVTTSLEANWMGVPLLTKKGNNFYSRIGTSINKNLSMEDWIANDDEDYVLKAVSKVSDLKKLFQIKKELRNKFLKSPLCDATRYVKHFENSLSLMWQTYLDKK